MGNVYQPKLKNGEACSVWWVSYYVNGKRIKESTHSTRESDAKQLLKVREGTVAKGEPVVPRQDRITYETCRAALEAHYRAKQSRDITEFLRRVKHLDTFFAGRRVATISQDDVDRYATLRYKADISPSTVRRELGSLTKMLRLAYKTHKLARLPLLEKPEEGDPRQGFFEDAQYAAVCARLPEDLQAAIHIMHTFGWRKREALDLQRRQLDLAVGTVRLDVGRTKNKEGRVVYLTTELKTQLSAQVARVQALEKQRGQIIPYLFPHLTGTRAGTKRGDFRKAWATACKAAGVAGRTRHDLRRTAVRNMERRGVPRSVAMKLTGHKTESVYRRYAIVSDTDLQAAAVKLEAPTAHGPVHSPVLGRRGKTRRVNS
jgi:integrase